eukprot:gene3044-biopygen9676
MKGSCGPPKKGLYRMAPPDFNDFATGCSATFISLGVVEAEVSSGGCGVCRAQKKWSSVGRAAPPPCPPSWRKGHAALPPATRAETGHPHEDVVGQHKGAGAHKNATGGTEKVVDGNPVENETAQEDTAGAHNDAGVPDKNATGGAEKIAAGYAIGVVVRAGGGLLRPRDVVRVGVGAQDSGAGVTRAWRGHGGRGAGMARAWRGRGAGVGAGTSCGPWRPCPPGRPTSRGSSRPR